MKRVLGLCVMVGLLISLTGCGAKSLSSYTWGSSLQTALDEIGVEKIKSIEDETSEATKNTVANVKIVTEKADLDALLSKNSDNSWNVLSITDASNHEKLYYERESLQLNSDGTQKDTIYDYRSGEVIKQGKPAEEAKDEQANAQTLTKDEVKVKAEKALSGYEVESLDILTRSDYKGYIISPQIKANVDREEALVLAGEISEKLKPISQYYNIEILNNYKLVLLIDQDGNTN